MVVQWLLLTTFLLIFLRKYFLSFTTTPILYYWILTFIGFYVIYLILILYKFNQKSNNKNKSFIFIILLAWLPLHWILFLIVFYTIFLVIILYYYYVNNNKNKKFVSKILVTWLKTLQNFSILIFNKKFKNFPLFDKNKILFIFICFFYLLFFGCFLIFMNYCC